MALSPDGHSLLVGDTSGNSIFFLDPATGEMQKRLPIGGSYQLMVSPDGKWLTVTGLARDQIDIYDPPPRCSSRTGSRSPRCRAISTTAPDSKTVFVSLQQTNRLVAIGAGGGTILWNAVVGNTPAGVLWHDGHVLVCLYGEADLAVVDPADGKILRRGADRTRGA